MPLRVSCDQLGVIEIVAGIEPYPVGQRATQCDFVGRVEQRDLDPRRFSIGCSR